MPFGGASEKAPPIGQWSHGRAILYHCFSTVSEYWYVFVARLHRFPFPPKKDNVMIFSTTTEMYFLMTTFSYTAPGKNKKLVNWQSQKRKKLAIFYTKILKRKVQ